MAIIAKASGGSRIPPLDEGVYTAVCTHLVDLGLQYSEKFDKTTRKILLMWQVIGESIEVNGEQVPRTIGKEYTTSLHEKSSLRHDLEAWRGKSFTDEELAGFDMKNILGKACQLQVIHRKTDTGVYQNIAAIMVIPRGMQAPTVTEVFYFDLEDENTYGVYEHLPNYIIEKIKAATNFPEFATTLIPTDDPKKVEFEELANEDDDELPF